MPETSSLLPDYCYEFIECKQRKKRELLVLMGGDNVEALARNLIERGIRWVCMLKGGIQAAIIDSPDLIRNG